ncbi:hypothetical protein IWQ62_006353 [Dispira parvispora]|uniref:Uncharacterized protein n=1 Tax=Dispira parvispora TaxID=1520584 RepID=A0A9W8AN69_9FUNG|nr:hypothetical protein IWQ62_006353 [Dispira parvispora]
MHRFTAVFFLVVSMSALSGIFGNPVNNPATDMTNPKLYRREAKELNFNLVWSVFQRYEDIFDMGEHSLYCLKDDLTGSLAVKTMYFGEASVAQGIYFEDTNQWYRLAKLRNGINTSDCYERAGGPETRNKVQLKPFTSIVTPLYPKDTKLFIKELNGTKVDYGAEHNGCVVVEDDYSFEGDLSMYISTGERKRKYFKGLDKVSVIEDKHCEIKQYKLE